MKILSATLSVKCDVNTWIVIGGYIHVIQHHEGVLVAPT